MSSIFVRPDSPPPRQPSPDFFPAPLPYPHHPRRIASHPKIRVHTPTIPPGLHGRTKTLQSARSCDVLSSRLAESRDPQSSSTRSPKLTVSSMSSPRSSPASSARNSPDFVPHHRRTLSVAFATPESSRSASPTATAVEHHIQQVPPVPSVPYRYTGPQHIICPTPVALNKPIIFTQRNSADATVEEIHFQVPVPSTPSPPLSDEKPKTRSSVESEGAAAAPVPPLEKHKSMGIACLKFFGIRSNSARQSPPRPAVTAI